MGQWGTTSLTANTNLNNTNFPAFWEDSGKIYTKGQGEYDINVYDIATGVWSTLVTIIDNSTWCYYGASYGLFANNEVSSELLWVYDNVVYVFCVMHVGTSLYGPCIIKINKSDGAHISTLNMGILGNGSNTTDFNWGRDKHKSVVKTSSNKIFVINWYTKQIWEFLPATDTFANTSVTWPTSDTHWLTCAATFGGPTACTYGDEIFICGNSSQIATYLAGYVYSLDASPTGTMEFTSKGVLNVAFGDTGNSYYKPTNGAFFNIGNMLYWYGGTYWGVNGVSNINGPVTVTKLMSLNPATNTWTQVTTLGTTPYIKQSARTKGASAYMLGGTVSGSSSQNLVKFTYILTNITNFSATYTPAVNTTPAFFTLTWDDSVEESFYIIEKKIDNGEYIKIAELVMNTVTYIDNVGIDLDAHTYSYRIKAAQIVVS
jgi:hypothetical protein